MSLDFEKKALVEDMIVKSAMMVNRLDLDGWIDLFLPEAKYLVIPRENRDCGYPIAIISCQSRAVIEDRILVLNSASKYNPHYDRHILSRTDVRAVNGDVVSTETNFMIVQSTKEGESKLFCAGCYEDEITLAGETPKFLQRVAVVDTFSVPNLIATPI